MQNLTKIWSKKNEFYWLWPKFKLFQSHPSNKELTTCLNPQQNLALIQVGNKSERKITPEKTRKKGIWLKMSLKPKRVDFNSTWKDLKETVKGVITFSNVPRAVWNDRFSGTIIFSLWCIFTNCNFYLLKYFFRRVFFVCGLSRTSCR